MSCRHPTLVVLISGSGTNLQALIDATSSPSHKLSNVEIALVVSNRANAYGIERAKLANIPTLTVKPYRSKLQARDQYDSDLVSQISSALGHKVPDLVVLAGWMHILSPSFIHQYKCIINLHPGLPNSQFVGLNCIERCYQKAIIDPSTRVGGCMVHYVTEELDLGECIIAKQVSVDPATDSLDDFAARVHHAEHEILVTAVEMVLTNRHLL